MASKRRGGNGFRPPELRGTLGTLLRTTTGVVRDALERGAREGRARLDGARASLDNRRAAGRRHDALADLGELLLDLIRRGEVDLAELPEARDLVRELDQLDDEAATASAADLDAEPELPRAASRRRFDDRGADDRRLDDRRRLPDERRPDDRRLSDRRADDRRRRADSDDDGTVSSSTWRTERPTRPDRPDRPDRPTIAERPDRPPRADRPDRPTIPERSERPTVYDRPHDGETGSSRAPTQPSKPTWRPSLDDAPLFSDKRSRVDQWNAAQTHPISRAGLGDPPGPDPRRAPSDADREPAERPDRDSERIRTEPSNRADRRATLPHDPTRKGGISFDDEDLADYMHPDDVPPKPNPKNPDDRDP